MIKPIPLILIFFLIALGIIYYDTNCIEIKHYQVENSPLGEVLRGVKIAFISDLHIKSIASRERKTLEILQEEKPDLILLGGDYIHFQSSYDPSISFFRQIDAPLGVYGVLGNTEYSNENGSCILCHLKGSKELIPNPKPVFLRNSSTEVNVNGRKLFIAGLDDPVNKKNDLLVTLKRNNGKNPSILLSHSPQVFREASNFGVDLILSGHNHGGQISLAYYARKMFHSDQTLEYLYGFFQGGKTLMYVSRGIGVSFLPFRLGVKPEITFLKFSNDQENYRDSFKITNQPGKTYFSGLSFTSLLDLFDLSGNFSNRPRASHLTPPSLAPVNATNPTNPNNPTKPSRLPPHGLLMFDFESDADFKKLNWECHKWFERSSEHATSGQYSLRVVLPPGQYPGIDFRGIKPKWSKYQHLKMDLFNPSEENFIFHLRIDDQKSGWEYADRFDRNFDLKPGMNHIFVPISSIKTNIKPHLMDLENIKRFMVFIHNNQKKRELFIDNIRLE